MFDDTEKVAVDLCKLTEMEEKQETQRQLRRYDESEKRVFIDGLVKKKLWN